MVNLKILKQNLAKYRKVKISNSTFLTFLHKKSSGDVRNNLKVIWLSEHYLLAVFKSGSPQYMSINVRTFKGLSKPVF